MDDTAAMQDSERAPAQLAVGMATVDMASNPEQLAAALKMLSSSSQPSTPQQAGDACSTASDSSAEHGGRHGAPRRHHSSVDVDAAKQAAMSALAGLDMTTTKANLDASKAAAATARANGEIPTHPRKSNLRSVSCRQLSSSGAPSGSGTTPPATKSVAFDESANGGFKRAPGGDAPRPGVWRGPSAPAAGVDGQPRRTRPPASRAISLPHIMQGRAGMANRLAATYAQDAALQQQLHLINAGGGQQYAGAGFSTLPHGAAGLGGVEPLTVYQLQAGGPVALGAQHCGGHPAGLVTLDDSVLQLRPGLVMPPAPQQQLSAAHAGAPGWGGGGGGVPAMGRWGSGQLSQQAVPAGLAQQPGNAQLLAQLQAGDGHWVAAAGPAASAGLQLPAGRPQGLVLQPGGGLGGLAGLQAQGALLAPGMQSPPSSSLAGGGTGGGGGGACSSSAASGLLESYQAASWSVLAAAQGEAALRDQLLTELVLLLTMLHTLSSVLKGSLGSAEALGDFSYLAAAARRHMATFSRLSQAGNVAVQLLAMIVPCACRHTGSAELMEAAFLVLDTLALANRDVATAVTQQRLQAQASLCMTLPVEQLLQQQTLGLHWITNLTSAVSRNRAVLESMAGSDGGGGQLTQQGLGGGLMPVGGLPLAASSQPMMLAPGSSAGSGLPGSALSPGRKTPLATYFEEGGSSVVGGASAGGAAAPGLTGGAGGMGQLSLGASAVGGAAGAGPSSGGGVVAALPDLLLSSDALGLGSRLGGGDEPLAGQLGGLDSKLGRLSLGVAPGGGSTGGGSAGGGGVAASGGSFTSMGGGLSLFGDGGLLAPPNSGPPSTGAAGVVGV